MFVPVINTSQHHSGSDNKLKVVYRVILAMLQQELEILDECNQKHPSWKDNLWTSTKLQAVHFLNCTLEVRIACIMTLGKGELSSEVSVNLFCTNLMVENYVKEICECKNIQPALVTVDIIDQVC